MLFQSFASYETHAHPHQTLLSAALELAESGISVVATTADKIPVVEKWGHLQKRIATPEELRSMFSHPKAQGIATIGGQVSGNLYTMDFEGKNHAHEPMECIYPLWEKMARDALESLGLTHLFDKIPLIQTQNHGIHGKWCVFGEFKLKNEKLAKRWVTNPETGDILTDAHGRPIADLLIESKGEGGYALCPPSPGYELIQGSLTQIPTFPLGVHEILVCCAKSLHTAFDKKSHQTDSQEESHPGNEGTGNGDKKPGDDYNQRGDWRSLMKAEGWELVRRSGEREFWRRPGSQNAWSATFSTQLNLLYVFSTNASPFEADRAYSPFAIYALLLHSGDFSAAAKDLASKGFGEQSHSKRNAHNGKASGNGKWSPFTANAKAGQNGSGGNGAGATTEAKASAQKEKESADDQPPEDLSASLIEAFFKTKQADFLDTRPPVFVNQLQPRRVIADVHLIIQAYSKEPLIFQKNGRLVRVTFNDDRAVMDYFTPDTLAPALNEYTDFFKVRLTKEGATFTPTPPPGYLVKGILHAPRHVVPKLDFIAQAPLFAPDGSFAKDSGYNPKVKAYLHLFDDMKLDEAEVDPTPENVAKSKALIEEMVAEFPFDDSASRQNAISLLLLPFLRPLINAEIPLYACDSSDPGTGKGLLIDSLLTPYLSHRPISNTEVMGDEWRKQLTTLLEHNPDVVYFDNAQKIDSSALASALTKGYWQDRRLGKNELVTCPIRAIFVVNGNNLEINGENARRVVWIRMVPNTADPDEREFQIADLRGWVASHRRELVIAALTLINNWVKAGMQPGHLRMGSFERWATILSGVMAANGYHEFMQNIPQLKSRVDKTREAMREFVTAWYNAHGTHEVNASQLFLLASMECLEESGEEVGQGILSELLTSNTRRGRANQLRNLLRQNTDRTFRLITTDPKGNEIQCKIESTNKRINGYMVYRLVLIRPESRPSDFTRPTSSPHTEAEAFRETTEQFTDAESRPHAEANDSSEQKNHTPEESDFETHFEDADDSVEVKARSRSDEGRRGHAASSSGKPESRPSRDTGTGSPSFTSFTDEVPNPDGNGNCGQVNLNEEFDQTGEPSAEAGSLGFDNDSGSDFSTAFAQAKAYVQARLQTQADLYKKGKAENLSAFHVGFIRSEANQRFGTDFVHDEIEAIWDSLVQQRE